MRPERGLMRTTKLLTTQSKQTNASMSPRLLLHGGLYLHLGQELYDQVIPRVAIIADAHYAKVHTIAEVASSLAGPRSTPAAESH